MKDALPNGPNGRPDPAAGVPAQPANVPASPTPGNSGNSNQNPKDETPKDKDDKQEQRLPLLVIVNTSETRVEANVHQPLHVVAQHALNESGNGEYPLSEWTLTDEHGTALDLKRKVEDYGFAPLTKLFLSKAVGAGGSTDVHTPPASSPIARPAQTAQVDPQVTRMKFNEELAKFRSSEAAQRARGILLLKAEFPCILLAFAAPRIQPTPLMFGVLIDFSEYDLLPPSVQFVDPFTERPLRFAEIPTQFLKRNGDLPVPQANQTIQVNLQNFLQPLLQHHAPDGPPFLCIRGTREYHEHPAHTGDFWDLYRGTSVGTLGYLVDALYAYGINPLTGYQLNFNLQMDIQRIAA